MFTGIIEEVGKVVLETRCIYVLTFNDSGGRVDIVGAIDWLGQQQRFSALIEAGAKLNWAVLEAQAVVGRDPGEGCEASHDRGGRVRGGGLDPKGLGVANCVYGDY